MLSTTPQMYTYVLHGLDKAAGVTVSPAEFEVLINGSLLDYVAQRYRGLEQNQRMTDALRVLIPSPAVIANTGAAVPGQEQFQLPYVAAPPVGVSHGYLFALSLAFSLVNPSTGAPVPCAPPDGWVSARPLPRDQRYAAGKNPFWRATDREPYYTMTGNLVQAHTGGALASQMLLEYLRYPVRLQLNPLVQPELPPLVNQEIADMAIRKHLEGIESGRLTTYAQEQQLRT